MGAITFSTDIMMGYLMFECEAVIADAPKLFFALTGTDMDAFTLDNDEMTITGGDLADEVDDPELTLTADADSLPSLTMLDATCPDAGAAFIWFAPSGTTAPSNDEDTVMDGADAFMAMEMADTVGDSYAEME
jgi:hypothetical protein